MKKNFTVYKASAGAGKTFTLVKEYLKIALNDENHIPVKYKRILAITFTNKAASEMKERVLRSLKEIAEKDNNSSEIKKILCTELCIPAHELESKAETLLSSLLHNYSDFSIGTIDGFIHKVVRTFAHDLHLPVNFEIETDVSKLVSEATALLLDKIGNDPEITQTLIEYIQSRTVENKNLNVERDIASFYKNAIAETGSQNIELLRSYSFSDLKNIRHELFKEIKGIENKFTSLGKDACALLNKNNIKADWFYMSGNGIGAYFEKLQNEITEPGKNVLNTIYENKWYPSKATDEIKNAIDTVKEELKSIYTKVEALLDKEYKHYLVYKLIEKNIYAMALLKELDLQLANYKKQNNILHISEFNKLIADIVLNEPTPFVFERLGEKYDHFLLDEFQDTSTLQWLNLLPLIDNTLAQGNFNMIVGDGKQAIYRWRGGEVEIFANMPDVPGSDKNDLLKERENNLKNHIRFDTLNKNFRSKTEIIHFNNTFFKLASSKLNDDYKKIYNTLEQEFDPKNTGGYVEINFSDYTNAIQVLEKTVRTIELLKQQKYTLNNIAILVRNNNEGMLAANYLSQNNIPVISSDSLLLKEFDEIKFLIHFLKSLSSQHNDIIIAALLKFLFENKYIACNNFNELLEMYKKEKSILGLLKKNNIHINLTELYKNDLPGLCEEIIRVFGLGEKYPASVQFFMDEVLKYSSGKTNNAGSFVQWWENSSKKFSVVIPASVNAVNILTIHKSKGLEYPAVIVPFCNWQLNKPSENIWITLNHSEKTQLGTGLVKTVKALENTNYKNEYENEINKSVLDNINLLYVAFTRAKNALYIYTDNLKKENTISGLLNDYALNYELQLSGDSVYSSGKLHPPVPDKNEKANIHPIDKYNTTNKKGEIHIRLRSKQMWDSEETAAKKAKGIVLHTALSKIKNAGDINKAITELLTKGIIGNDDVQLLFHKINEIVLHPHLERFFNPNNTIIIESDILLPGGEIARPDRILIEDNEIVVIDFKTGIPKNEHKTQLLNYTTVLKRMYAKSVKGALVYTEPIEFIEV